MSSRQRASFLESYATIKRCITAVVDETYGALGLGATQSKLLRRIGENRRMSQADLARATATDPALTGRALQTLLDRGWVRRRRSKEDKRAFSLELTESGEALLEKVLAARDAMILRIGECVNDADVAALSRIARKLTESFPEPLKESKAARPRAKG